MWTIGRMIILGISALVITLVVVALWPMGSIHEVKYKERHSHKVITEKVAAAGWMRWLYHNPVGKLTLWAIIKRQWLSERIGKHMDSPASAKRIASFVSNNGIDLSEAQEEHFDTFNAFFTRRLKANARPIDSASNSIVSPADGKILIYPNLANTDFIIKGYRFDINSFLQDHNLSPKFATGSMAVIRLAPTDYHRFHAPVAGQIEGYKHISGDYYSVSPLALHAQPQLFCLNERSYHQLYNPQLGHFVMAEVGATFVGSIVQSFAGQSLQKGEEKGYFKFGGSTVVLIFAPGAVQYDKDLLENSQAGMETSVRMGETIGSSVLL